MAYITTALKSNWDDEQYIPNYTPFRKTHPSDLTTSSLIARFQGTRRFMTRYDIIIIEETPLIATLRTITARFFLASNRPNEIVKAPQFARRFPKNLSTDMIYGRKF